MCISDKPDSVESRPPAPAAAPGLHGIAQPPEDQPDRALPPSPAHNQLLASAVRLMSAADERLATDGQQLLVNRKLSASDKQLESADEQLGLDPRTRKAGRPERRLVSQRHEKHEVLETQSDQPERGHRDRHEQMVKFRAGTSPGPSFEVDLS